MRAVLNQNNSAKLGPVLTLRSVSIQFNEKMIRIHIFYLTTAGWEICLIGKLFTFRGVSFSSLQTEKYERVQ